jgi:hypothetical protein
VFLFRWNLESESHHELSVEGNLKIKAALALEMALTTFNFSTDLIDFLRFLPFKNQNPLQKHAHQRTDP